MSGVVADRRVEFVHRLRGLPVDRLIGVWSCSAVDRLIGVWHWLIGLSAYLISGKRNVNSGVSACQLSSFSAICCVLSAYQLIGVKDRGVDFIDRLTCLLAYRHATCDDRLVVYRRGESAYRRVGLVVHRCRPAGVVKHHLISMRN